RMCCSEATDFFFQAEDGIRAFHVTGVQTCALPISSGHAGEADSGLVRSVDGDPATAWRVADAGAGASWQVELPAARALTGYALTTTPAGADLHPRARRVGAADDGPPAAAPGPPTPRAPRARRRDPPV